MYRKTYRCARPVTHRLATATSALAVVLASAGFPTLTAAQQVELQPALDLARGNDLVTPLETSDAFLLRPSLDASVLGSDLDLAARLAGFGYDTWSSGIDGRLKLPTLQMKELNLRTVPSLAGEASWYADGSRSGNVIGRVRLEYGDERFTLWAGGGAGAALNSRGWRGLSLFESGARAALGALDLRLSAESRSVNVTFTGAPGDSARQGNTFEGTAQDGLLGFGGLQPQQLRYLDAELSVGLELGRVRLDATVGARQGNEFVDSDGWAHLQASVPINARLTAMASGGWVAGRPEQGIRTREYYMFGVRLKLRTIQMRVPGATTVEIMGDFNSWRPQPMNPVGGDVFEFREQLTPGVYRVNIRVDGGPWIVPPGLTGISDEFDGRVGLLVIQPDA